MTTSDRGEATSEYDSVLARVRDLVYKDKKRVSFAQLSRHFEVHVDEARRMLDQMRQEDSDGRLKVMYQLAGNSNDDSDPNELKIERFMVVEQSEVESAKSSFKNLGGEWIFSLELADEEVTCFRARVPAVTSQGDIEKMQSLTHIVNPRIELRVIPDGWWKPFDGKKPIVEEKIIFDRKKHEEEKKKNEEKDKEEKKKNFFASGNKKKQDDDKKRDEVDSKKESDSEEEESEDDKESGKDEESEEDEKEVEESEEKKTNGDVKKDEEDDKESEDEAVSSYKQKMLKMKMNKGEVVEVVKKDEEQLKECFVKLEKMDDEEVSKKTKKKEKEDKTEEKDKEKVENKPKVEEKGKVKGKEQPAKKKTITDLTNVKPGAKQMLISSMFKPTQKQQTITSMFKIKPKETTENKPTENGATENGTTEKESKPEPESKPKQESKQKPEPKSKKPEPKPKSAPKSKPEPKLKPESKSKPEKRPSYNSDGEDSEEEEFVAKKPSKYKRVRVIDSDSD